MKKYRRLTKALPAALLCMSGFALTACFDDSDTVPEKYKEWKQKNEQYVQDQELKTNPDGSLYYSRVVPSWAPGAYSLIHWHNDRSLTANNLSPMDNSIVQITYELFNIDGERISDSFSNPDSVYTSRPNQNIIGVWSSLTRMNVGDSVTLVIPFQAGYGERTTGGINPYSTLIYNIKLKAITAYEVP